MIMETKLNQTTSKRGLSSKYSLFTYRFMKVGLNTEARPIENSLDRSLVTQSLLCRRSETFRVKSVAVNVVVS